MRSILQGFLRARDGIALIEFGLMLPFLLIMLVGALELGRAIVITQRTEKVAYAIADITSQYPPATAARSAGEINATELANNVFPQFSRIMGIYADPKQQVVILTSVRRDNNVKRVKWQMAGGGTLTAGVSSDVNGLSPAAIGAGVKDQPTSFSAASEAQLAGMPNDENMIVAEIFYNYNPVWNKLTGAIHTAAGPDGKPVTIAHPKLLAKRMYFRPRNGSLTCLPPIFTYPVASDSTGC